MAPTKNVWTDSELNMIGLGQDLKNTEALCATDQRRMREMEAEIQQLKSQNAENELLYQGRMHNVAQHLAALSTALRAGIVGSDTSSGDNNTATPDMTAYERVDAVIGDLAVQIERAGNGQAYQTKVAFDCNHANKITKLGKRMRKVSGNIWQGQWGQQG
jgi:hypothetical protein